MGTVTSFNYFGADISDDGSKQEVLSRIAQATAALTKLKPTWRDNNISLGSKVKHAPILFYSILFYPITLEGRRGTTDEFATTPFHLDLFSAALVELAKSIPPSGF